MNASPRHLALFVNVDTLAGRYGADLHAADLLREARRFGPVEAPVAYGDWVRQRRLQQEFDDAGFRLVATPRNASEARLAWEDEAAQQVAFVEQAVRISLDALEYALTHPRIDAVAIAGASPLYAILTRRLRAQGLSVFGIGPDTAVCAEWAAACTRFVFAPVMLGHKVAAATFEEGEARLSALIARAPAGTFSAEAPDAALAALAAADPTFDPRNYGCADFGAWYSNYAHLLRARPATRRSEFGAPDLMTHLGDPRQPVDSVARAVLMRALVDASWQGFPMSIARFRDMVQAAAPDFSERALGFESFLACLEAFPDLVSIDRNAWEVYPNDGVIALDPKRPGTSPDTVTAGRPERRRSRRATGETGALSESPDGTRAAPEGSGRPPATDAVTALRPGPPS
jgi:hypothetical protein